MKQKYEELLKFVQSLEGDLHKFVDKGQAAAGTRLRKGLSDLKRKAQEMRNLVQEIKAERKAPKSDQPQQ